MSIRGISSALLLCAACQAIVPNQAVDSRLIQNVTGPWVAQTSRGPLYLFLLEKNGELWGGVAHSIPGTAVSYVYGHRNADIVELRSHDVSIPPNVCASDADCCQDLPLGARAFCYCHLPTPPCPDCAPPIGHGEGAGVQSGGVCKMRRVCFGDQATCARAAESPSLQGRVQVMAGQSDATRLVFDGAQVTYVLGSSTSLGQADALEFHRLAEWQSTFFGSGELPASTDSNPDLDCESGDTAPNDADADGDGIPDGCVEFVAQLGLIPQGARDLLEGYHCGNHHADPGEPCDDWLAGDDARLCSACHPSQCGDGIIEPGEECDDANADNEDDCSNDCHFTTRCGDGRVHKRGTPPFEQCDEGEYNAPGSPDFTHHCLPNCIQARCGDGHLDQSAEECDQGPANDDAGDCTTACTRARCGDGKLHTSGTPPYEQCDDGNTDDHDTCLSTCVPARCGDGVQNCPPKAGGGCAAEECDDGNNISGDGCNASCSLVDSEDFPCNHITPLDQTSPSVGIQPSGGFVIAWEDKSEFGPDVSAQAVRARLFAPDGGPRVNPITGDVFEFEVNTTTQRAQKSPSLGVSPGDGRFVVLFEDQSELGSCITTPPGVPYTAVRARMFAEDGTPMAAPLAPSTDPQSDWEVVASVGSPRHAPSDMTNPQITWTHTGDRFLVVWENSNFVCGQPRTGWADVYGRMFDRDGAPLGGSFKINTTDNDAAGNRADQGQPQAEFFDDGSFVVVWQDASQQAPDTSGGAVRGRLFSGAPDGTPRTNGVTGDTNDFVLATLVDSDQGQPVVATQPGGFVVAWSDSSQLGHDNDNLAVRARVFSLAGVPQATPLSSHPSCGGATPNPCCAASTCDFQVNTTEQGLQQAFSLSAAPDGTFLIAFIDQSQLGADESSSAIRGRAFYADGTPRPTTYASGIGPGAWRATDDFVINTRTQFSQFSPSAAARGDGSCVVAFADNSALGPDTYPWGIRARILFRVLGP